VRTDEKLTVFLELEAELNSVEHIANTQRRRLQQQLRLHRQLLESSYG